MNVNYSDLKEYLEGKTTDQQSEEIRNWMKNPENEEEVRLLLGEIWTHSQIRLKGEKPNFELLLDRLHYRIKTQTVQGKAQNIQAKTLSHRLVQQFSRIAAILILPILLLTAYFYFNPDRNFSRLADAPAMREVYTKPGTRTMLTLPDGTKVWLNDGTLFKYPESFSGNKREVFVDGEAFFDVTTNSQKPFVVDNPIMKTIVTGTQFNLYAYAADQYFEATLLEGKIHLSGRAGKIELDPGQQIQFDAGSKQLLKQQVNPENAAAWVDGKLVIHNERLDLAVKKLSRWYNVDISINSSKLKAYELTCTLENEKLEQCLQLIAHALPIQYRVKSVHSDNQFRQKIELMMK
ncbi:FecR family protein [Sunxiuqinia sp. sy24]|uniref:FecR family protein n=1 Tax=Sunxiuqinia sp. sy24 TaxID=3461495 RepID=UPI004046137A